MTPIGKYALKANKMGMQELNLENIWNTETLQRQKLPGFFDESKLIANTQRAVNENNEEGIFQDFFRRT